MPSKKKKYNARFPPARIKKIMQTDEDVGKVAAAVPVIISRALELFIDSLISKTGETTHSKNAKTLTPTHIKQTIHGEKKFDFLRDLVAGIPDHHAEDEVELPSTSSAKKPRKPRKKKDDPGKIRSRRNTESSGDNDNNEEDEEESTETDDESRSQMSESSSSNMASYPSMTNQMGYTPGPHAGNFPDFRMGQAMPRMGLPGTPTTPLDVAGSVLVPPYSPQMQSNLVQNFYHTQSFFQANPFMQQTAGPVNLCTKNDNSISSNGSSSMSVKTEGNLPMPSSSKQFDQAFPSSSTSISSQMTFNPNPKLNSEDDDYDT